MELKPKIVLLGLGSEIQTDSGIGIRMVRDLKYRFLNSNVYFKEVNAGGLAILEELQGFDKAIVFDAIKTKTGYPATVYHFLSHNFKETFHLSNFHNVSFRKTSKLTETFGLKMPREFHVIAVEVEETEKISNGLSSGIRPYYGKIIKDVVLIVQKILGVKSSKPTQAYHGNWL